MITLIVGFIVSHLGAILGGIVAAGGVLFGFVTKKNADTKVAQAGQQVAQAQATTAQAQEQVAQTNNAEAQANAAAAQAGAQATKERSDAESTVGALPAGGAAQQLLDEWARPGEDAGRGGAGSAGQDPNR